jgi:hypothetical protein
MKIQVVLGYISKNPNIEFTGSHPLQCQRMRGNLHCNGFYHGGFHLCENRLQIKRFGCCAHNRKFSLTDFVPYSANNACEFTFITEHCFNKMSGSGFTICTGDPDQGEIPAGVVVKICGHQCKCQAGRVYPGKGNSRRHIYIFFDHQPYSSPG